jgi:hypothetical protein
MVPLVVMMRELRPSVRKLALQRVNTTSRF